MSDVRREGVRMYAPPLEQVDIDELVQLDGKVEDGLQVGHGRAGGAGGPAGR